MLMQDQHLKEVYRTLHGCVYQDNKRCVLVLEWNGRTSALKLPCFFSLRKLAAQIEIERLLNNPDPSHDFEILVPCGCDRCFVLTVSEILEFQDLLEGTKVMMELNSILHERLRRNLVSL